MERSIREEREMEVKKKHNLSSFPFHNCIVATLVTSWVAGSTVMRA